MVALLAACGGASPGASASYSTDLAAGLAAVKSGDLSSAAQLLQRALVLQPKSAVAHYDLGVVYQNENQRKGAFTQYADALRISPDFPSAQYNEAILETPINAPLAEYLYRRIIAEKPDAATAYLNLGLIEVGVHSPAIQSQGRKAIAKALHLQPPLASSLPEALKASLAPAGPTTTLPPKPASASPTTD
jgi:tetratricopeptide (TPR) repeat protein